MSFNVQQQKVINHYREMYNIASVISDDVVVEIIKRDMIQSGKVYAGFESLVQGAAESRQNSENTGVFGFGFNNEENIELALSNDTSQYLTLLPTREESQALSFMQRILQESENTVTEREKEAGPISAFTNFLFRQVWGSKYSKRSVIKEIKEFEKQLKEIEKAANGEKIYRDFLGNVNTVTFKDEFKKVRGVEFNADKISATIEKSAEIANIRTCYQSVQAVKELLGYSSSGIYNITHPQEATAAILQAFEVLGVTKGEDKANLLKQIFEQYKDHPVMKEYNCKGLTFDKNQNGEYCIYRWLDYEGNSSEAPMEVIRLIVGELVNRLDKTLATGLNIEFDENTTPDELSKLCNETISKHEEEYQKMFAESFGGKNVKELSDEYVLKQQQDVATVEMVGNMVSMALMLAPGGVTATSGWLLKIGKFAQTAEKMAKVGATLKKVQKVASPLVMGNMILSPTQLIEQGFSENGFSDEELDEWKNRVVQNSVYMVAGMTSSNVAAKCAAQYKTARLVQALKNSGKSFDEIQAMIKANPSQFSDDIVKEFAKISKQGMYGQIGAEIAFDLSSTVALNLIMGNGTLTKTEVINSIIFAISGGTLQKQFAPLSTETKIAFLMDNFKDYGITHADAVNILKTMDNISAGANVGVNVKGVNEGVNKGKIGNNTTGKTPHTQNPKAMNLPEEFVTIIEKRAGDLRKINEIKDTKTFYEEVYNILLEEMGIPKECAPKLDFSQTHENARMGYVDSENTLYVYNLVENRELAVGLIAHELKHFVQFKDEITTYSENPREGISNLIDAKAEAHAKESGQSFEEAYDDVLGWFFASDGNLKPHVQKIIDTYDRIDPMSEKGQLVSKYLENESHYIDKTESYSIDGTLKSYEEQITEKEAYEVSDAVSTAYNKLVLGNDNTVKTRESGVRFTPMEIEVDNLYNNNIRSVYQDKKFPLYTVKGIDVEFSEKSGAKRLKRSKLPQNEPVILVSQVGTNAGTSALDKTLFTYEMRECAALAIVDRTNNRQTLIHVNPGLSIEANKTIIKHILSESNPKDVEISVVHGDSESTFGTVQFILDTIEEIAPTNKVNLYNFDKFGKYGGVLLKNGELTCCDVNKPTLYDNKNIQVNPKDNITCAIKKASKPNVTTPKIPDFVADKANAKFTADDIDKAIEDILKFYKDNADDLRKNFEQKGFFDLGRAQSRVKGESSLRDKIVDYLKKHPNATHLDIWQEIRDCFACRTIIQESDFTKHPEVSKILETGDKKAAVLKAAELQSQEAVNTIKKLIDDNVRGDNKVKAARFTNYVSKDGVPYLSENQLAEIKQYAADKGITLDIVVKIDETDPKYHATIQADGKPTTRSQPSGYTALQMNFIYENGAIFEWQYRGEAVNKFAEAEHIAYDARTGKKLSGGDSKLEELYEPIQKMLDDKNMPEDVYNKYNEYLNAYYYHCRLLELGFESTPPKLSDYEIMGYKFDPILEAEGLMKLHDVAEALKNDRISTHDAKRIINNFKKGIDEFVPMSEDDFALVLKDMGYDDATIEKVKLKNECFQAEINAMLVLKETLGEDFERIDPEDLIDMSELYSGYSRVNITKHNIETLKNKLGSNFTNYDYKEILKENNIEGILKVIYEYKGEEKLSQNAINLLIWSNERALKELTPERFEAYIKIIDNVNEGFKVSERNLDLVDMLILHPEINDNKIIFDMLSNCALQLGKVGDQKNGVRIILNEVEDCVNNYSKYKDLEVSDFTKTTLGLIKKLTPENQDNAIKLIETLESKLKCDYETAILITRYLNKHPNLDFADFARFVETVDFNKLTELVPDFAKYTDNDKITFLDFHYQNGTKEFNAETLSLKGDLTTFLAQNYLGENLGTLLAIFPKTDRNIGTLPKSWYDVPMKAIEAETEIRNAIDIFRQKVEDESNAFSYNETVVEPAIKELENKLISILGKKAKIKRLDAGTFGTGYKISVEGAEPVVLKIYHKNQNPSTELEHGQRAEIPLGPFLNEHSDSFVHFYFGKVPDNYTKDGYVITEFMEDGKASQYTGNDDPNYSISSSDAWKGHNIISNKIIDYGAVRVAPQNDTKPFKFDDLIDKNE